GDAREHPLAEPTIEAFRSGLTVPIGDRGIFQGISSEPYFFDEDDLELAELLITHTTATLDRVEETQRLNKLNRATRQLMTAETHEAVAEEGCDIASAVLNAALTVVFYHNEGLLVPMAATATASEVLEGPRPIEGPDDGSGDSPRWAAMAQGETVRDATVDDDRWELLNVPLGEQGVLCVGSRVQGAFEEGDIVLAETLAANIEAAFTRADREQRRREQARQLQRQNERLDRFASIVSHDLRNPLHIASTRAALAREEPDGEHVEAIQNALDRMETIIDDTLSLARQGKTVEETEPVSLSKVAARSWDQVDTAGAGLEIVSDATVQADADRLQNVFENLFRNAVEHGSTSRQPPADDAVEHGSTEPSPLSVRIGTLPEGFYVEDTGSGIPAGEREQVFDLGYSSDPDGTGFGLAIVGEIVESHGWTITVAESNEGGARFEITGVDVGHATAREADDTQPEPFLAVVDSALQQCPAGLVPAGFQRSDRRAGGPAVAGRGQTDERPEQEIHRERDGAVAPAGVQRRDPPAGSDQRDPLADRRGRGIEHSDEKRREHGVGLGDRRPARVAADGVDVFPAGTVDAPPGLPEHCRHDVDADDPALGADLLAEVREVRAGATAHLDDGVAGREIERARGTGAPGAHARHVRDEVVQLGTPAVERVGEIDAVVRHRSDRTLAERPGDRGGVRAEDVQRRFDPEAAGLVQHVRVGFGSERVGDRLVDVALGVELRGGAPLCREGIAVLAGRQQDAGDVLADAELRLAGDRHLPAHREQPARHAGDVVDRLGVRETLHEVRPHRGDLLGERLGVAEDPQPPAH
ncbi:hypothetical protein BRC69_05020, partial [Halobacteriales archaeon QH_6_66_25]